MNPPWDGIELRKSLRIDAEGMLCSLSPEENKAQPAEILMHELLVHKVELEMQNEELRRAYMALEEARDRYLDLYEFAPVGYISISRDGLISDINLTGSTLLGVDRAQLIQRRFSTFVAVPDKDRWHRLFLAMMERERGEKHAFGLDMANADGTVFYAHLNCVLRETPEAPLILWVALSDISHIQRAGSE